MAIQKSGEYSKSKYGYPKTVMDIQQSRAQWYKVPFYHLFALWISKNQKSFSLCDIPGDVMISQNSSYVHSLISYVIQKSFWMISI